MIWFDFLRPKAYSEPRLDSTIVFNEALYYITVAYAQLERGILQEREKPEWTRLAVKTSRSVGPLDG